MGWKGYRWVWRLEAPLHVGACPAGILARCRMYIPARAMWGAITAQLARRGREGFPDYEGVGERLKTSARFSYLYPAHRTSSGWKPWLPEFKEGEGLVWAPENGSGQSIPERQMRMRLLTTRPGTAIAPASDSAEEATLHETECINTRWRKAQNEKAPEGPVAMVGYVFLLEEELKEKLEGIDEITVGGDSRYGLGWLRREGGLEERSKFFSYDVDLSGQDPVVSSDVVLAHAKHANRDSEGLEGQLEAVGGWNGVKDRPQQAGLLWVPGSWWRKEDPAPSPRWKVDREGYWERV